ncbi:hypothetical protein [Natronorubrum sp. FCH18a]|uniref:hypothetical protein n=1 Tax=Natronorubrum sp. FCH18a TaxID=3447018 RepID=UPI003F514BB9
MSGIETALATAAVNVVSKEFTQWLKDRGPDLSESDWKQAGQPVVRQIQAAYKQHQAGQLPKEDRVQRQLQQGGHVFRELAIIGENRGLDDSVTELYQEFAEACAVWETSPELEIGTEPEDEAERFYDLCDEYQDAV